MRRGITIAIVTLVVLGSLVGFVYAFGTPQTPAATPAAGAGEAVAAVQGQTDAQAQPSAMGDVPKPAAGTEAPPADPSAPLAIQIPGCRCHSDDPKLVEQHAAYRMNQCAGCHGGQTPTGR